MAAVEETPQAEKKITIDFSETRRRSFLPENWSETRDTNIKNILDFAFNEDDDLFILMQSRAVCDEKPLRKFCTGSKYLGQWNKLGIAGKGVYKYPHGVIYDGYFNRNGQCHGTGILVYPNGHRIEGEWKNGVLGPNCNFIAEAGVLMNKKYCLMPDRRFQVECENDFNPAGQEYLTDEIPPPREFPEGCYDLVEGFYDPSIKTVIGYKREEKQAHKDHKERKSSTKYIFSGDEVRHTAFSEVSKKTESEKNLETLMSRRVFEEKKVVSWIPSKPQEEWIVKNARKGWDEPVGYRPDLYEEWTKGGRSLNDAEAEDSQGVDSKCQLRSLNLHTEEPRSGRLLTFVKNVLEQKDSAPVDVLAKMFRKGSDRIRTNMGIRGFSITQAKLCEEDLNRLIKSKEIV